MHATQAYPKVTVRGVFYIWHAPYKQLTVEQVFQSSFSARLLATAVKQSMVIIRQASTSTSNSWFLIIFPEF